MTSGRGIDPTHRTFVSYIDKSREYYLARGYGNPYRWAHFGDVPFTSLPRPLSESRLTLVTTASILDVEGRISREVFSMASDSPPESLDTRHRSWDKDATHTDDLDSFFPVHRLQELAGEGRIGGLTPRLHGTPISYSQRQTMEADAPEVLKRCQEDGADAAILVPL